MAADRVAMKRKDSPWLGLLLGAAWLGAVAWLAQQVRGVRATGQQALEPTSTVEGTRCRYQPPPACNACRYEAPPTKWRKVSYDFIHLVGMVLVSVMGALFGAVLGGLISNPKSMPGWSVWLLAIAAVSIALGIGLTFFPLKKRATPTSGKGETSPGRGECAEGA